MNTLIAINGLSKHYGKAPSPALSNLTLSVKAGECYGFLGANGAGKSTAIRLLLNFIQPTSGSATLAGYDVVSQGVSARSKVGYLAGDIALFQKTTGAQLLDFLCELQGVSDMSYRKLLEKRFSPDLHKPINSLSKGNKQKVGLIQAFMHQPDVIILDEPTSGLDPLMQEAFYETVKENTKRGAAVFMSSHNLTETQRICDRVAIIRKGKLVHEQSLHENTALTKPAYTLILKKPAPAKLLNDKSIEVVKKISDVHLIVRPSDDLASALSAISKYAIEEFSSKVTDLEDEFLEFYGEAK